MSEKITLKVRLQPITSGFSTFDGEEPFYEQVLVWRMDKREYPIALMHVDTFMNSETDSLTDKLSRGEQVIGTMTIEEWE